jgi:hypothetical protein
MERSKDHRYLEDNFFYDIDTLYPSQENIKLIPRKDIRLA